MPYKVRGAQQLHHERVNRDNLLPNIPHSSINFNHISKI